MASCFVAGYAAYILAINPSMTPKDVSYVIRENSLKGFVAGVGKFINIPTFISVTKPTISLNSTCTKLFTQQSSLCLKSS